jgi:hypothetical protein
MNKKHGYDKIPCFSYLSGYTIYGGEGVWRETGDLLQQIKGFWSQKIVVISSIPVIRATVDFFQKQSISGLVLIL